jgi:hypothetical protein
MRRRMNKDQGVEWDDAVSEIQAKKQGVTSSRRITGGSN